MIKGGWQLAGGHGRVDRAQAIADMRLYVEAGITTFDCADIYTGVEELIGEFLAGYRPGSEGRPAVQVHTKYVPDLADLPSLTQGEGRGGPSIDRSGACGWRGSISSSSTGGTTRCRAGSRPHAGWTISAWRARSPTSG